MHRPPKKLKRFQKPSRGGLAVLGLTAWLSLWFAPTHAEAHGFTADVVDIKRMMNGKYRIIIFYTHLQVGEYRRAQIDYDNAQKATEDFQKLVRGAEFFIGKAANIHFHEKAEEPKPY